MSLGDIRRQVCGGVFSPHTKIQIARQVLKAIKVLHEIGYLHRDIKPANVAVGLPPRDSIIYLIDFGIGRPYRDKDGAVKPPREQVNFMGTKKYASMEAICQREQSRRDDLEVWMYMMIEMYDEDNLTWNNLEPDQDQSHTDQRMLLLYKSREQYAGMFDEVPEKWLNIIELLGSMGYEDAGDFTQLNLLLNQICIDENIDENQPLDWVGKKTKSPEKPKKPEGKAGEEKKRDRKEVRKKRTKEKKEDEEKAPRKQHRRRRKTNEKSSSGDDDSESGDSEDYEAFLRWKKRRRNKKKRRSNDRGSNEHSDRRRLRPRKKTSAEKKKKEPEPALAEVDCKDLTVPKPPEVVESPAKDQIGEDKDGKKNKTPEAKLVPVEVPKDKKKGPIKKIEGTPEFINASDNDREDKVKKAGPKLKKDGTPESNESNNDREDKPKKKSIRKKGNKTPESNDDDDKFDQKKKDGRKLEKKVDVRKKITGEKPLVVKPVDPKKENEVVPAKKSDDKKK